MLKKKSKRRAQIKKYSNIILEDQIHLNPNKKQLNLASKYHLNQRSPNRKIDSINCTTIELIGTNTPNFGSQMSIKPSKL